MPADGAADRGGRLEGVGGAVVGDAVAGLGDVADAGRAAADGRALGVGGAGGAHAVAGLGDVADAGRRAAGGADGLDGVGRAGRGRCRRRSRRRRRRRPRPGRWWWPARRRRPGRSMLPPSQVSATSQTPAEARQVVLAGSMASAGQAALAPSQVSATSQTPAEARQTVVSGSTASAGQPPPRPVQVSATSQTPAAARQTVPAGYEAVVGRLVAEVLAGGPAEARIATASHAGAGAAGLGAAAEEAVVALAVRHARHAGRDRAQEGRRVDVADRAVTGRVRRAERAAPVVVLGARWSAGRPPVTTPSSLPRMALSVSVTDAPDRETAVDAGDGVEDADAVAEALDAVAAGRDARGGRHDVDAAEPATG